MIDRQGLADYSTENSVISLILILQFCLFLFFFFCFLVRSCCLATIILSLRSQALLNYIFGWIPRIHESMHWRRKWQPTPVFLPGESTQQQQQEYRCGQIRFWKFDQFAFLSNLDQRKLQSVKMGKKLQKHQQI